MTPRYIFEFDTFEQARFYRYVNGAGGWIFRPEDDGKILLFSPEVSPWNIFNHPVTRGRSGTLVGSA